MNKPGGMSDQQYSEIINLVAEFENESDRATVILGVAKLDKQLRTLLIKTLHHHTKNDDDLFDNDSPLSSFSAKIKLSYRLNLIDKNFFDTLNLIRKIRNNFAHEYKNCNLNKGKLKDWTLGLIKPVKDFEYYNFIKEYYVKRGKKQNYSIDFSIVLLLMIIRLDKAINEAEIVDIEYCSFIPPEFYNWKSNSSKTNS